MAETLSIHAMKIVDIPMIASPPTSAGRLPTRSIRSPTTSTSPYMPTMCPLITQNVSPVLCPWPTTTYPDSFMTDTITEKLATAATSAVRRPAGAGSFQRRAVAVLRLVLRAVPQRLPDLLRIRAHREGDAETDDHDQAGDEPRDDERRCPRSGRPRTAA